MCWMAVFRKWAPADPMHFLAFPLGFLGSQAPGGGPRPKPCTIFLSFPSRPRIGSSHGIFPAKAKEKKQEAMGEKAGKSLACGLGTLFCQDPDPSGEGFF